MQMAGEGLSSEAFSHLEPGDVASVAVSCEHIHKIYPSSWKFSRNLYAQILASASKSRICLALQIPAICLMGKPVPWSLVELYRLVEFYLLPPSS